ncbi:tetratricopeptide repeat protein [Labilithrix luteola]|nr:hypothetical protein [Labilithrix luteola]
MLFRPRRFAIVKVASLALTALALVSSARTANAQMSESERKSAARAAYQEGVTLQDQGKAAEALTRFEAAQKLFDAPTHLLRIAECQALVGKLVEASETYETLIRKNLGPNPPDAFVQAQQQGQGELTPLRQRIPTLRVTVRPDPSQMQNLQVTANGTQMPNEVLGITRPVNPGVYRFNAAANGWQANAPQDVNVVEREQKNVEIVMVQRAGMAATPGTVTLPPPPPPYAGDPNSAERLNQPFVQREVPSSLGFLFGVRAGAFVPGGGVDPNLSFENVASAGGGGAIDAYFRVARMLLLGGSVEYAGLKSPSKLDTLGAGVTADGSVHTTYAGLSIGLVPNIDRVSFIGDLGFGFRSLKQTLTESTGAEQTHSYSGTEFALGAGLSIPAGPIRLVPKASINYGEFDKAENCVSGNCNSTSISSTTGHTFFFVGLGVYYSLDIGKKPAPKVAALQPQ